MANYVNQGFSADLPADEGYLNMSDTLAGRPHSYISIQGASCSSPGTENDYAEIHDVAMDVAMDTDNHGYLQPNNMQHVDHRHETAEAESAGQSEFQMMPIQNSHHTPTPNRSCSLDRLVSVLIAVIFAASTAGLLGYVIGMHIRDAPIDNLCTDACDENGWCVQQDGSFLCICLPGYYGNGTSCSEVTDSECTDSCDENALCDVTGCVCLLGYEGNGTACSDINECLDMNTCGTNDACINTQGTYTCEGCAGLNTTSINGICYSSHGQTTAEKKSWDDAQVDCSSRGGHLVDFETVHEWNALSDYITDLGTVSGHSPWIGARASPAGSSTFFWTDGERVGLPDSWFNSPNGDCICAYSASSVPLLRRPCSEIRSYVCEYV